jgi:NitT/TauT family transport system ATP-binding protein
MYIEVEHASKHFPRRRRHGRGVELFQAFSDVSFSIRRGEFICLLGPSGCGKTTLMNAMAGFEPLSAGRIVIHGREVRRPSEKYVTIFQNYGLFPWRSVRRNIELGLEGKGRFSGRERREIAARYLDLVGMSDQAEQHPRHLSGGQQQRVAIARALATNPEIMFMDEPFAALDAITRCRLQADLRKIVAAEHKTVVFVTHDIEEAVFLADRILVMQPNPGRVRLDLAVTLTHPRVRSESAFVEHKRKIFDTFFEGMERSVEYVI